MALLIPAKLGTDTVARAEGLSRFTTKSLLSMFFPGGSKRAWYGPLLPDEQAEDHPSYSALKGLLSHSLYFCHLPKH
jgi:hypothetical protein